MTHLYVLSFVVFLDGPIFFYIGEIWPSHVRVQGFAIGISSSVTCNTIWTSAAPAAFNSIGWAYYVFFLVQAATGGVAALQYFPDTSRKPLEKGVALFGERVDVVIFRKELEKAKLTATNSDNGSL